MDNDIKEVEVIVEGEVQGVGYRQYVAKIGRKLKLAGCVENLEDGSVRICCKGNENVINEFIKKIDVKRPEVAPLIVVENISKTQLAEGTIKQHNFREKYSESNAEMAQGFSTGMNYLTLLNTSTQTSFKNMDEKYDKISQAMYAVVEKIEERNKTFESRMEKTEQNIESLLKILTQKLG